MIGYTTIGSNQFEKALDFYDKLFAVIGGKRMMEYPTQILYGFAKGPAFGVCKPHNKQPATNGNGAMIALSVGTKENVDAVYNEALKLGGSDEGPPGDRGGGFYGAYFRDLDNNKLCAYTMLKG
jgi:catechol 2,3-dioxygenase-like lactoylglutathione lyase family enzyme